MCASVCAFGGTGGFGLGLTAGVSGTSGAGAASDVRLGAAVVRYIGKRDTNNNQKEQREPGAVPWGGQARALNAHHRDVMPDFHHLKE